MAVIKAARALAWWTHSNISSPDLYRARRDSFARLRAALSETVPAAPGTSQGKALLMAGLRFGSGRRLADYPGMVTRVESEARAAGVEEGRRGVEAELLKHGKLHVGTVLGYEAGWFEGANHAAQAHHATEAACSDDACPLNWEAAGAPPEPSVHEHDPNWNPDDPDYGYCERCGAILHRDAAGTVTALEAASPEPSAEPDREGYQKGLRDAADVIRQALETVRHEAADLPSGRAGVAAREHSIALIEALADRSAPLRQPVDAEDPR